MPHDISIDEAEVSPPRRRDDTIWDDRRRQLIVLAGVLAVLVALAFDRLWWALGLAGATWILQAVVPRKPYTVSDVPSRVWEGWRLRRPERAFTSVGDSVLTEDERRRRASQRGRAKLNLIAVRKPSAGDDEVDEVDWIAELVGANGQSTLFLEITSFSRQNFGPFTDRVHASLGFVEAIKDVMALMDPKQDRLTMAISHDPFNQFPFANWIGPRLIIIDDGDRVEESILEDGFDGDEVVFNGDGEKFGEAFQNRMIIAITTNRQSKFGKMVDQGRQILTYEDMDMLKAKRLIDVLVGRLASVGATVRQPSVLEVITWVRNTFQAYNAEETWKMLNDDLADIDDQKLSDFSDSRLIQAGIYVEGGGELHRTYAEMNGTFVRTLYVSKWPRRRLLIGALNELYLNPLGSPHGLCLDLTRKSATTEFFRISTLRKWWNAWLGRKSVTSAREQIRTADMEGADWDLALSQAAPASRALRVYVTGRTLDELDSNTTAMRDLFKGHRIYLKPAVGKGDHIPNLWAFLGVDASRV